MAHLTFGQKRTRSQIALPDQLLFQLGEQSPLKHARTLVRANVNPEPPADREDGDLHQEEPHSKPPSSTKRSASPTFPGGSSLLSVPLPERGSKRRKRNVNTSIMHSYNRSLSHPQTLETPRFLNQIRDASHSPPPRAKSVPILPSGGPSTFPRIDLRNPPSSPHRSGSLSSSKQEEAQDLRIHFNLLVKKSDSIQDESCLPLNVDLLKRDIPSLPENLRSYRNAGESVINTVSTPIIPVVSHSRLFSMSPLTPISEILPYELATGSRTDLDGKEKDQVPPKFLAIESSKSSSTSKYLKAIDSPCSQLFPSSYPSVKSAGHHFPSNSSATVSKDAFVVLMKQARNIKIPQPAKARLKAAFPEMGSPSGASKSTNASTSGPTHSLIVKSLKEKMKVEGGSGNPKTTLKSRMRPKITPNIKDSSIVSYLTPKSSTPLQSRSFTPPQAVPSVLTLQSPPSIPKDGQSKTEEKSEQHKVDVSMDVIKGDSPQGSNMILATVLFSGQPVAAVGSLPAVLKEDHSEKDDLFKRNVGDVSKSGRLGDSSHRSGAMSTTPLLVDPSTVTGELPLYLPSEVNTEQFGVNALEDVYQGNTSKELLMIPGERMFPISSKNKSKNSVSIKVKAGNCAGHPLIDEPVQSSKINKLKSNSPFRGILPGSMPLSKSTKKKSANKRLPTAPVDRITRSVSARKNNTVVQGPQVKAYAPGAPRNSVTSHLSLTMEKPFPTTSPPHTTLSPLPNPTSTSPDLPPDSEMFTSSNLSSLSSEAATDSAVLPSSVSSRKRSIEFVTRPTLSTAAKQVSPTKTSAKTPIRAFSFTKPGTPSPAKLARSHASRPSIIGISRTSGSFMKITVPPQSLSTLTSALEKLKMPAPIRPNTNVEFCRDEGPNNCCGEGIARVSQDRLVTNRAISEIAPSRSRLFLGGKVSSSSPRKSSAFGKGAILRGPGGLRFPGTRPGGLQSRIFAVGSSAFPGVMRRTTQKASRKTSLPRIIGSPVKASGMTSGIDLNLEQPDWQSRSTEGTGSNVFLPELDLPKYPNLTETMKEEGKGIEAHWKTNPSRRVSMASHALSQSLSALPSTAKESKDYRDRARPETPKRIRSGLRSASTTQLPSWTKTTTDTTGSSDMGGAGLTPRRSARNIKKSTKLKILEGCVIFVDVRNNDGDDVGSLFVEMLDGVGAKLLTRVGQTCTHIVFKNGLASTITRYRLLREPKPLVVGIAWVVECVEQMKYVNEERFLVDLQGVNVAGTNKRRRSMLPKLISHLPEKCSEAEHSNADGDLSMDGSTTSSILLEEDLTPLERARLRKGKIIVASMM